MDKSVVSAFIAVQIEAINNEKNSENNKVNQMNSKYPTSELKKRGIILTNLVISAVKSGLNGKILIEFQSNLNHMNFRVGDEVSVDSEQENQTSLMSGIVVKVVQEFITIAIKNDLPGDLPDRFTLRRLANSISYQRMETALRKLEKEDPSDLYKVLFNLATPTKQKIDVIDFFDKTLNESQMLAVKGCIEADQIFLLHGPPGTGKSYTAVEAIRQLVSRGKKLLVCGPSNISVDNLVERLSKCKIDMVRIGHPARILNSVVHYSLDFRLSNCDQGQIVNDVRKELDTNFKSLKKAVKGSEKYKTYQEIKVLRQELKTREKALLNSIISNAQVVLTTLNGSSSHLLSNTLFDVLLIDEASQALEAECWIPILKARKLILAGDHLQLPPTIQSSEPKIIKTLSLTLFERVLQMYGQDIKQLLNVQYRMNDEILGFSSLKFYENKLISGPKIGSRLLTDLKGVKDNEITSVPLVFIDTAGAGYDESTNEEDSKYNKNEAECAFHYTRKLVQSNILEEDIAVISPYNGQISILKSLFQSNFPKVELGTVDGFQGREKEVVIFSMVRSNSDGQVGFLSEDRRLNVAITRPKRHLCIIGDSQTMNRNPFLKSFVDYLEENAVVEFPE